MTYLRYTDDAKLRNCLRVVLLCHEASIRNLAKSSENYRARVSHKVLIGRYSTTSDFFPICFTLVRSISTHSIITSPNIPNMLRLRNCLHFDGPVRQAVLLPFELRYQLLLIRISRHKKCKVVVRWLTRRFIA